MGDQLREPVGLQEVVGLRVVVAVVLADGGLGVGVLLMVYVLHVKVVDFDWVAVLARLCVGVWLQVRENDSERDWEGESESLMVGVGLRERLGLGDSVMLWLPDLVGLGGEGVGVGLKVGVGEVVEVMVGVRERLRGWEKDTVAVTEWEKVGVRLGLGLPEGLCV